MAEAKGSNLNTKESLSQTSNAKLKQDMDKLSASFKKMKRVKVTFPTNMQRYLGTRVFLGHNGAGIVVPVDGEAHEIPEVFAKKAERLKENVTT